jgi:hypothetical protein
VEDRRKQQRDKLREEHLKENPQARIYFDPHAYARLEIRLIDEQCYVSYAICRSIWQDQKRSEGGAFFDAVREFCLVPLIDKGAGDFVGELESLEKHTNRPGSLSSSKSFFERELITIRAEWSIRSKLDAIKSERNRPPGLADALKAGMFFASSKSVEATPSPNRSSLGRKERRPLAFTALAGNLWKQKKGSNGRVSDGGLKAIADELDSKQFTPPADYLEGKAAKELKARNSKNANSKSGGAIRTWSVLVTRKDKDDLRAMRKLLTRCASKQA